jgi:hypothetical protein
VAAAAATASAAAGSAEAAIRSAACVAESKDVAEDGAFGVTTLDRKSHCHGHVKDARHPQGVKAQLWMSSCPRVIKCIWAMHFLRDVCPGVMWNTLKGCQFFQADSRYLLINVWSSKGAAELYGMLCCCCSRATSRADSAKRDSDTGVDCAALASIDLIAARMSCNDSTSTWTQYIWYSDSRLWEYGATEVFKPAVIDLRCRGVWHPQDAYDVLAAELAMGIPMAPPPQFCVDMLDILSYCSVVWPSFARRSFKKPVFVDECFELCGDDDVDGLF